MKKKIVFIRNSDIRFDTRLRKAMHESVDCGIESIFWGWIRDGGSKPEKYQKVNDKEISSDYYMLPAIFGGGFRNILKLARFNIWLFMKLIRERDSYNSIYVCDLDVAIPALWVKLIFNKKIIYDIFDFYSHTHSMPAIIKKIVEKIEYSACKFSDYVIVCTEKRSRTLYEATGIKPIIIYNTPNYNINQDSCGNKIIKKDKFRIVYVGTLPLETRLLHEITENIKLKDEIEFHVAGVGPLKNYFEDCAESHKNIFFYGQITNDEAMKLQSCADILFATYDPSLEINRNSAPNKVYEAMALGKPIIVCRNTDADSVITENECGSAINYEANEFMEIVDKYQKDIELKVKHGNNGLKMYQSNYNWAICRKRLQGIFSAL